MVDSTCQVHLIPLDVEVASQDDPRERPISVAPVNISTAAYPLSAKSSDSSSRNSLPKSLLVDFCQAAEKMRAISSAIITDEALSVNKKLLLMSLEPQKSEQHTTESESEADQPSATPPKKRRCVSREQRALANQASRAKRMADQLRLLEDLHRRLFLELEDAVGELARESS